MARLYSWNPVNGPQAPPRKETWAEFWSKWCHFSKEPYLDRLAADPDRPIWEKELSFEKGNDGNLQVLLDDLEGTEFRGLEEGKIWHTLMSTLHALLWLHRGRTFRDRNWYLSDSIPTAPDLSWKPVVHGDIHPVFIHYNKSTELRRPYGDTKLHVPTDATVLSSFRDSLRLGEQIADMYRAPELVFAQNDGSTIEPCGANSDLWSVAAICVRMMGGPSDDEDQASEVPIEQHFLELCLAMCVEGKTQWQADDLPNAYSQFLRAAIANLLVFHPAQRPHIEQAIQFARKQFVQWRKEVRLSRPPGAHDDPAWIKGSLYTNRAMRQALAQQQQVQVDRRTDEEDAPA